MKKLIYILAAWFLLEWVYTTKIKPFVIAEFIPAAKKDTSQPNPPNAEPGTKPNKGSFVYGIDIYHSDGRGYELEKLDTGKDNISFVICKATEGNYKTDPKFEKNWEILQQKGVIRGAYHFYVCDVDPLLQAQYFLQQIDSVSHITANDLPPVIDIESPAVNGNCNRIQDNILLFLNAVEQKLSRKPMIYTNLRGGNDFLNDPRFRSYPLWIAEPGVKTPGLPLTWKKEGWTIWQRSTVYRLGNENDFDIFNGTLDELNDFIRKY